MIREVISSCERSWLLLALLALLAPAVSVKAQDLSIPQQRVLALADSLYGAAAADSAQIVLSAAIPTARAENDSLYLQNLIVRQGAQMAAFGNVVPAEPILREALALAEARVDSAVVCQVLRWLGFSIANQGRWEEAEATTIRQIDLAEALDLGQMLGWARVALGWYAEQRGQTERAVLENRLAVEIFRSLSDSTGIAWSLNNLGNGLIDLGERSGAQAAYLEAAEIARRLDFTMVEAMATNNLGVLEFDGGDPGIAVAQFRRAEELQIRLGHATERIATGLNIGLCLIYLDKLEEAAQQLTGIAAAAEELQQPECAARARLALANLRHQQGKLDAAKALLRRVVFEPMDLAPAERTEGMSTLATILSYQDSLQVSLSLLEEASELLVDQPNSARALRVENLRGYLLVRTQHPRDGLAVLERVERVARETGLSGIRVQALARAAKAHRALDRPDSSRSLLARAARVWEAERDLPIDPEWREQRGALGSRIYTDWASHLIAADDDSLRTAFHQLQRFKGRTLFERMSGPGQFLPEVIPAEAVDFVSLEKLQSEVLDEGELLLDAYLGPETSLLFAVTRQEVRALTWPAAPELKKRLEFFYDLHRLPATSDVTLAELRALQEVGRSLGDQLLGEIADLVAASRRVVIIPDAELNLLPWSSLTLSASQDRTETIALADKAVTTAPSATIFADLRTDLRAGMQKADGINDSDSRVTVRVFAGTSLFGESILPGARQEAEWLSDAFANVTWSTTPISSLYEWCRYDVLHFAAHARSHDASPWQSEIRLGEGAGESVRAADIAGLELDATLAVLAGCESAGGNILSGEGVQGLTSAFLGAGTQAVLATLWPVDDAATLSFIQHFYRSLSSGENAADALRNAQETLRRDPLTNHPFFWAGFQLVGEGNVTVSLQSKRRLAWWPLVPAGFLVLAVILLRRRRLS